MLLSVPSYLPYVTVCTIIPSLCYCLYHRTFLMLLSVQSYLPYVTVCTIIPSLCYCLYHHTFLMLLSVPSYLPSSFLWHSPFGHVLSHTSLPHTLTAMYRLISRFEIGYRNFKVTGIAQLLIPIIQAITFWLGCSLDSSRFGSHYMQNDQTGPGPTELLVQWVPLEPFSWVRMPNLEADQSPPTNTEFKNEWSHMFTSLIHLHGVDRDFFSTYSLFAGG